MATARSRIATRTHTTRALVVRRVDYGDSDLVLTLFTESLGKVSALARGARKGQRRFGGVLEPLHTLSMRLDERATSELMALRESKIETPRTRLLTSLEQMEAAGRALGWVRRAAPPRTPEPEVWRALVALLARLDALDAAGSARTELAQTGLALLAAFGWGLDLERCVSCGKPCPEGNSGQVDVARGGLVCRSCGGAAFRIASAPRLRMIRAAAGEPGALQQSDLDVALDLVERGFRAHLGFD